MLFESKNFRKALVGAVLLGSLTTAHAQFITGASLGWSGVEGVGGTVTVSGSQSYSGYAGFMTWSVQNLAAVPLGGLGGRHSLGQNDGLGAGTFDIRTICGELQGLQNPQLTNAWNSDDAALAAAIHRAGSVIGADTGGGVTAFAHALGNSNRAAGLQTAVWAARYGGAAQWTQAAGFASVTLGTVTFSSTVAIMDWARFYYQLVDGSDPSNWMMYRSVYLESVNNGTQGQDQFTIDTRNPPQSVPEPFTMALGIAGASVYIRRRIQSKKA